MKKISSALISVFYKDGLDKIVRKLSEYGVKIYSTGGTQSFIESIGIQVTPVEKITGFPSILGGRVKTLHPSVFGGILYRRNNLQDISEINEYNIPPIDLVIVDLYPFEETVKNGATEDEIIEKIDIGGVSLIRAAAKNFTDTVIVSNKNQYVSLYNIISENNCSTTLENRRNFAKDAFANTSAYDNLIKNYFSDIKSYELRYGENPHQKAYFTGNLDKFFTKHQGKELSYNNLLDIDSAINLVLDFPKEEILFAIIKHNNACGFSFGNTVKEAYIKALSCDPISAFGGILCCNSKIDENAAIEIDKLFFEIIIASQYSQKAIEILQNKKNRIILELKDTQVSNTTVRIVLNGVLEQNRDNIILKTEDLKIVTENKPTQSQILDMIYADIIVKHTKSNAIVLFKNKQLLALGTGQTSRIDSLEQAIHKAKKFGFDLKDAVMSSDAFFPFPDCVEIAGKEGINAIIQPGGSIKDQLSVDYCNSNNISMAISGFRHFKH